MERLYVRIGGGAGWRVGRAGRAHHVARGDVDNGPNVFAQGCSKRTRDFG